ncbi:MAG: ATP-binding protein [Deltaproteobacteria bacterium]|nr:ATP-binding protein [Deltaproteobacteria bacterium]
MGGAEGATPDEAELALAHLEHELAWLEALLRLRLRELQAAGVLPSPDERFPGTVVAPQEVEARLRGYRASTPEHRTAAEREAVEALAQAARARDGFVAAHEGPASRLPLHVLRTRLRLDPDEYMLFLVALAPELDPSFARLYAWLQNHFDRPYATLALVADVLVRRRPVAVHRLLRLQGPLVQHGLVRIGAAPPGGSTMYAPLSIDPRIVRLAQGEVELDPSLEPWCAVLGARPTSSMVLEAAIEPRVLALVDQFARLCDQPWDLPVLELSAPPETGKRHLAQVLAHALGTHVLAIDVEALIDLHEPEAALRSALREALIRGALACVRCGELLAPATGPASDDRPERRALPPRRWIPQALRGFPGALVLTTTGEARALELDRVVHRLGWGYPDEAHATRLWDALLPARHRGEGAAPAELARRFELAPGQMVTALAAALAEHPGRRLQGGAVHQQVRAQVRNRLGEAAHLVESTATWDDLIVTDEVQVKLQELVNRHRYGHVAAREWGLGRRFGGSLGLSVLFAGPSGTGKTMAAGIVARELGLDLYQVDLSRVVSKWLGETEKALARIFDEAERARAILLFDEADSLFSKRTSVESSNDRYANLEVNFLLQRVERFRGVAILTTNFPDSLDQAFKRRLSAQVTFPPPDVTQREALWRSMLAQPGLKKDDGIGYEALARRFELAGGLIKNAVVRAVFLALPAGVPVSEDLLVRAATAEMADHGMLVRQARR